MKPQLEVKVGQIWTDRDWRMQGRKFRVEEINSANIRPYAVCLVLSSGKQTCISLDRFRADGTGYDLVEDVGDGRR